MIDFRQHRAAGFRRSWVDTAVRRAAAERFLLTPWYEFAGRRETLSMWADHQWAPDDFVASVRKHYAEIERDFRRFASGIVSPWPPTSEQGA